MQHMIKNRKTLDVNLREQLIKAIEECGCTFINVVGYIPENAEGGEEELVYVESSGGRENTTTNNWKEEFYTVGLRSLKTQKDNNAMSNAEKKVWALYYCLQNNESQCTFIIDTMTQPRMMETDNSRRVYYEFMVSIKS